jgi:HK97 family phage portal protein
MKFKQINVSNNDSQFLESRKFQKAEIASIFRIPPHLVNDLENATFTNISQQSTEFATYTMTPWVQRFEEPLNIILKAIDPTLYVEFNMNALVRGDISTRYEAYGKGIRDSWLTPNEVRNKEGMNPIEGLDDVLIPLNLSKGENDAKTE